jgi:hypothetical protein
MGWRLFINDIASSDWGFLCLSHPKPQPCSPMNHAYHTMDIIQCLITNPSFYPSQERITEKEYSTYANICKRIYRILAHPSHGSTAIYLKYENEYSLCSRVCFNFLPN